MPCLDEGISDSKKTGIQKNLWHKVVSGKALQGLNWWDGVVKAEHYRIWMVLPYVITCLVRKWRHHWQYFGTCICDLHTIWIHVGSRTPRLSHSPSPNCSRTLYRSNIPTLSLAIILYNNITNELSLASTPVVLKQHRSGLATNFVVGYLARKFPKFTKFPVQLTNFSFSF